MLRTEVAFPKDEPPNWLSSTKWSGLIPLHTSNTRKTQVVFMHLYVCNSNNKEKKSLNLRDCEGQLRGLDEGGGRHFIFKSCKEIQPNF